MGSIFSNYERRPGVHIGGGLRGFASFFVACLAGLGVIVGVPALFCLPLALHLAVGMLIVKLLSYVLTCAFSLPLLTWTMSLEIATVLWLVRVILSYIFGAIFSRD